jgi:hypothetical protein
MQAYMPMAKGVPLHAAGLDFDSCAAGSISPGSTSLRPIQSGEFLPG